MDSNLLSNIKFNCDVSDAQFWGYFSICGLLLRYRDLYRSEKSLKPWTDINRNDIGEWIAGKEAQWPELERKSFRELTIGNKTFLPFDVDGINRMLREQGLVYGAGYGMYMKPTFFLAELRSVREHSGLTVYTTGAEYVRDLFTAPGMLQEQTIFIRLEPLMLLLLYKYSELNTRPSAATEDAFAHYGFRHRQLIDDTFEKRMEEAAGRYAEVLLYHELAEAREDVPEWKDILAAAGDRKVELYIRSVKDLLADTSGHGPYKRVVETRDRGALGLMVAFMDGYRKMLFPEMKAAYGEFLHTADWGLIEEARKKGYVRLHAERDKVVETYKNNSDDFAAGLRKLVDGL